MKTNSYTYHSLLLNLLLSGMLWLTACSEKKEIKDPLFRSLGSKSTGISFRNDLVYTKEFNLFKYMYFYNGSGLGAADFNRDGKRICFLAPTRAGINYTSTRAS